MPKIVIIAHDIRSAQNIGSILRTADGLGLEQVYLTGYSPYPLQKKDSRLPHEVKSVTNKINKTALGAEKTYGIHYSDIKRLIVELKAQAYTIVALEQSNNSVHLTDLKNHSKIALILGREVEGIAPEVITLADKVVEIPMAGAKESYNVAIACAIAAYHLTYMN